MSVISSVLDIRNSVLHFTIRAKYANNKFYLKTQQTV